MITDLSTIDCFYHVYGERKDINPLIVEYEGNSWEDYPDPNFDPNKVDEDKKTYNDPRFAVQTQSLLEKLIYIEENFISPDECQKFIDLSLLNKDNEMPYGDESRGGDTYLTTVDWKNYGAVYYGGDVNTTVPSLDHEVVSRVNSICKNFDSDANLDYVGVVKMASWYIYETTC